MVHKQSDRAPQVLLVKTGFSLTVSPPHGLMILSAVLKQEGYQTILFDLTVSPEKRGELLKTCEREKPLWVGFSACTPEIPAVAELVLMIKAANPGLCCVLGGIHGSFLPKETLEDVNVDAVMVGEGEGRVVALTRLLEQGRRDLWSIPGVVAKDGKGQVHANNDPVEPTDINTLPLTDWDSIELDRYQRKPWQLISRGKRIATVFTSRGCPFRCSFCANPNYAGRKFRKRAPDRVVDEIELLHDQHGVDEIHLGDDIFNADLNHAKSILREMISRGVSVFWKPPGGMRLDSFDEEFLDLVVRSGAYQVGFGIESGCREILAKVNRRMDLEEARKNLEEYRRAGLSTFGYFILGLPGETKETIERTIRLACSLPLVQIHVSLCVPYPGSDLFADLDARGLLHHRWGEYRHFYTFPVSEVPPEFLIRSLRRFYFRFYARPTRAWSLLREVFRSGIFSFLRVAFYYITGGFKK